MGELPYLIIMLIVFIGSWIGFKKKVKKSENEEEIRSAFVPFLLVGGLFLTSLAVFLT